MQLRALAKMPQKSTIVAGKGQMDGVDPRKGGIWLNRSSPSGVPLLTAERENAG